MTKKVSPRQVPNRDDFYMGMAFWAAAKSKDPKTQIGALIVSSENIPMGWGYNGPPRQMNDAALNWDRPEKYDFILHAEENAIQHSSGYLDGATIYVTGKPCKKCILKIVAHGIKRVVYYDLQKQADNSSMFANDADLQKTEEIANAGAVQMVKFGGNLNWMRDRIKLMETSGVFG